MAGPYDFLANAPHGFDDWSQSREGERLRDIAGLRTILHDYGQPPRGGFQRDSFIPYHWLVTPEGRLIQRYRPDQIAPHAHHSNPTTLGIAYGAPVGSELTPQARATMAWLQQNMPQGTQYETHGQAYERTRGTPQQASVAGRGPDEARWFGVFTNPGTPTPPTQVAAAPPPVANRSFVAHAGLTPPAPTPALPPVAAPAPPAPVARAPAPPPIAFAPQAATPPSPVPQVSPIDSMFGARPGSTASVADSLTGMSGLFGIGNDRGSAGSSAPAPDGQELAKQQQTLSQTLAQLIRGGYRDGGAVAKALRIAARDTNTKPTDKQKEAGMKAWLKTGDTKKPAGSLRRYADGGSVEGKWTMPLLRGAKNVGRNISELMGTGRKQPQAVAIALDVARRRGKANGGYADGGDPPLSDGPMSMPPVPPEFAPAPSMAELIASDPYGFGPIDWAERGRTSPGDREPLDTPITDYVLGPDADRPGLRTAERVMRDMGRGVVMGGPEMVESGLGNLEGAVSEGSLSRGAGAVGQIGLGAVAPVLPWLRPFQAGMAARPAATIFGTGAAYMGAPVLAERGFGGSGAQAQAPAAEPDDGLTPPQRKRQADLQRLLQRRNLDEDSRYTLMQELQGITAITKAHLDRKGDAAIRLQEAEAKAKRDEAATEAARAREKTDLEAKRTREATDAETWRNTPTARAYPWFGPAAATTGLGVGSILAGVLSRRGISNFNTRMGEYGTRWQSALKNAASARTPAARQQYITEAQALSDDVTALTRRGPKLQGLAPYGAAVGTTELGFAAPTILDYSSSAPGSPLRDYTMKSLDIRTAEPWSRYIFGGLLGAAAGKGGMFAGKVATREPPDFRARTDAISERFPRRLRSETEPPASQTPLSPSADRSLPSPTPGAAPAPTTPPALSRLEDRPTPAPRPEGPRPLSSLPKPDANVTPPVPTGTTIPAEPPAPPVVVRNRRDSLGREYNYIPGQGRVRDPLRENDTAPAAPSARGSRPAKPDKPKAKAKPEKPAEEPPARRQRPESDADRANREARESLRRRGIVDPDEDGRRHGGRVNETALHIAHKYANGGSAPFGYGMRETETFVIPARNDGGVVVGPVVGTTGGREDAKPVDVPGGSYVVPADVVAACGDGNTLAGHKVMERVFGPSNRPRAAGGAVPILISDGEHVLTSEQVAKVGRGNHDQGCRVLDKWVTDARAKNIKRLKGLPGPAKG